MTPDGRWAVSASEDKTVRAWNLRRLTGTTRLIGRKSRMLRKFDATVQAVAFTPDGRFVLAGSGDTLRLLEFSTGREVHAVERRGSRVTNVAVTPDGDNVIASCEDGSLRVRRVSDGSLRVLAAHDSGGWLPANPHLGIVALPDNHHVVVARKDNVVEVRNLLDGNEVLIATFDQLPISLAVNDDASALLVGDWAGDVHCLEYVRGRDA